MDPLDQLRGALSDGCSLEIADQVAEAMTLLGVLGLAFVWDYADPDTGLAHGWHLLRQVDGEWFGLADTWAEFLQGSGAAPTDLGAVGSLSDIVPASPVRGTLASFTAS